MKTKTKSAKQLISAKLDQLNKAQIMKDLVLLKGWKRPTVDSSLSRGRVSKRMAIDLQSITSIHMSFWQDPIAYNEVGAKN